jgi:Protein of unknown function (DUF2550)
VLVLETVLAVLLLAVLLLLAVAARRRWLQAAGGTVELSLRLKQPANGRGWVNGVGRFVDDELRWYRVFSLSPRPRRVLSRRTLEVVQRRPPSGAEHLALMEGAVVMECRVGDRPVELAMQPSAVTGFLAWLESRPPGATLPVWPPRRPA